MSSSKAERHQNRIPASCSIVIPVYNEEKLIVENTKRLMEFLAAQNITSEIFIGNNGSTDATLERARKLQKKHPKRIRVLHSPVRGVGTVFKRAVQRARYDNIVSVDMDLSTELSFIPKALRLLKKHDIVVGSKKMGTQKRSWLRTVPSSVFIFLVKVFTGMKFKDYSMAGKAYKRDIILQHMDRIDNGTSYVIDIIYFASRSKKKLVEIPVQCLDTRKSKFNIILESLYRFRNLMKLFGFIVRNR